MDDPQGIRQSKTICLCSIPPKMTHTAHSKIVCILNFILSSVQIRAVTVFTLYFNYFFNIHIYAEISVQLEVQQVHLQQPMHRLFTNTTVQPCLLYAISLNFSPGLHH